MNDDDPLTFDSVVVPILGTADDHSQMIADFILPELITFVSILAVMSVIKAIIFR